MSKKDFLTRYVSTPDGRIIIDVSAPKVEDLYNNFDKTAPYLKKDLDQDLVDYLIDCAREIGKLPFLVRVNLASIREDTPKARLRKSIQNFFVYLQALERRQLQTIFRTSLILFGIGLTLVTLSIWVNQMLSPDTTVVLKVLAEGLTIAAWVSLWEALAVFLIQWPSHWKEIRLYKRLAGAPVEFKESPTASTEAQP